MSDDNCGFDMYLLKNPTVAGTSLVTNNMVAAPLTTEYS